MGLAQAQGLEVSASTIHRYSQRAVLVRPSTKRRRLRHCPGLERRVNGVGSHPKESLASLDAIEADSATLNGGGRVRKPPASPRRKPTPRQRVRWKAVQQAKLRGLSIRAIARELGIHRNTVRKYAEAKSPPMIRTRGRSRVSQSDGMTAA